MPLTGRVFKVQDQLALVPILLGDFPPVFGYAPWTGVTVNAAYIVQIEITPILTIDFTISSSSGTTDSAGSFAVSSDVQNPFEGLQVWVALTVSSGVPLYRSNLVPLQDINAGQLNLWLFPDSLPSSDGITAGTISRQLSQANLPASTMLSSGPAGLDLSGITESAGFPFPPDQIHIIDLGIAIGADSSPDLQSFVDVSIRSSNISVDWPTSMFVSANDVLQKIQPYISEAASSMNSNVLTRMENILESQDNVTPAMAEKFFTQEVSVTFTNVNFSNHTWGIGDTGDDTIVMTADPCIGFPRTVTPGEPVL
jgi:hypothetical protein